MTFEPPKDYVSSDSDSTDTGNSVHDDTVHTITPDDKVTCTINPTSEPTSSADVVILSSPLKKGKKRKKNMNKWKANVAKKLRNTGKKYETNQKKIKNERSLKPPCTEKCKIKCTSKLTEDDRLKFFKSYWDLGEINKQRQFINNSMELIKPKYRYERVGGTRKKRSFNNAFYFYQNDEKIRVCKTFFKNTLDINDRPIRTVQKKRHLTGGMQDFFF